MKSPIVPIVAMLVLTGCSAAPPVTPEISFVGIATGTLASDPNGLSFRSEFAPEDRELLGVVAFSHIGDGTRVMASWFQPDDRRPPFGRKIIETESGAKIALFSLATNAPAWEPGPLMLQIHATLDVPTGSGSQTRPLTDSGSTRFFIGMEDDEIVEYMKEYEEWKKM